MKVSPPGVIEIRLLAHRWVNELKQFHTDAISSHQKTDFDFHQFVTVYAKYGSIWRLVTISETRLRLQSTKPEHFGVPCLCRGGVWDSDGNVIDDVIMLKRDKYYGYFCLLLRVPDDLRSWCAVF